VSAVYCTFDSSSDVGFARIQSQATSTNAHPTESVSPPLVAPSEAAVEAGGTGEEELDELEEKSDWLSFRRGYQGKSAFRLNSFCFTYSSSSTLVCRSYHVLSTTSLAKRSNTTWSVRMDDYDEDERDDDG